MLHLLGLGLENGLLEPESSALTIKATAPPGYRVMVTKQPVIIYCEQANE